MRPPEVADSQAHPPRPGHRLVGRVVVRPLAAVARVAVVRDVDEDVALLFSVAGGNAITVADSDAVSVQTTLTAADGSAMALFYSARCRFELGQYEEAIKSYQAAKVSGYLDFGFFATTGNAASTGCAAAPARSSAAAPISTSRKACLPKRLPRS